MGELPQFEMLRGLRRELNSCSPPSASPPPSLTTFSDCLFIPMAVNFDVVKREAVAVPPQHCITERTRMPRWYYRTHFECTVSVCLSLVVVVHRRWAISHRAAMPDMHLQRHKVDSNTFAREAQLGDERILSQDDWDQICRTCARSQQIRSNAANARLK